MGKKYGRRPYDDRESVLSTVISFAVSPREKDLIRKNAKEVGMAMSKYLRSLCKDTLLVDLDNEEGIRVD